MKINEVEKILDLNKQTLYFYEREGLISPKRHNNQYREYSKEDVEILKKIKVLRELEFSIDDIHLLLKNQITLKESLDNKSEILDEKIKALEKAKTKVNCIKQKEIPLISQVNPIKTIDDGIHLIKKSTKRVSLGRRLTKEFLIYQIRCRFLISLMMLLACYMGYEIYLKDYLSLFFVLLPSIIFAFLMFASIGLESFMELDEYGVHYYQVTNIKNHIKYITGVIQNNDNEIKYKRYSEIEKICVYVIDRYMHIPNSKLAMRINTLDFKFVFDDQHSFIITNPLILENDSQWLANVLLENVKDIDDKYNALKLLADGKNINELK